jgi:DNA-directed RNA polymerase specialized sigma24 family protein
VSRAGGLAALRGDEERLYRDHHRRLVSSVGWAVEADPALIEDACARAWEQLIRHQPHRTERIFAWLRTVAIREAWALARREQREAGPGADDPREVAAGQPAPLDVDVALETRGALEALGALRERERRYLALKAAGLLLQGDRRPLRRHLRQRQQAPGPSQGPAARARRPVGHPRRRRRPHAAAHEEVRPMAIGSCRTEGVASAVVDRATWTLNRPLAARQLRGIVRANAGPSSGVDAAGHRRSTKRGSAVRSRAGPSARARCRDRDLSRGRGHPECPGGRRAGARGADDWDRRAGAP